MPTIANPPVAGSVRPHCGCDTSQPVIGTLAGAAGSGVVSFGASGRSGGSGGTVSSVAEEPRWTSMYAPPPTTTSATTATRTATRRPAWLGRRPGRGERSHDRYVRTPGRVVDHASRHDSVTYALPPPQPTAPASCIYSTRVRVWALWLRHKPQTRTEVS